MKEWIIKKLKTLKEKHPELIEQLSLKRYSKDIKLTEKVMKQIVFWDEYLSIVHGLNSPILIDYHDKLNIISIDKDQEDTNK